MEQLIRPDATNQDQPDHAQSLAYRYVSVLFWPVVAAGIFQIAGLHETNTNQIILLTNAILVTAVIWKAHHEHANWQTASVVGALCGAVSALLVAIFLLITNFHVVRVFNLITQPAITGVFTSIATGFFYSILQLVRIKMHAKNTLNKKSDIV